MPTSNEKVVVRLLPEQRAELDAVVRRQAAGVSHHRRARILLLSDADHPDGQRPDAYIAGVVGVSERQVARVRQAFVRDGLGAARRKPKASSDRPPVIDGAGEARLVTLCCSDPPDGRARWTLSLLVDELCRLQVVTTVCRETVRKCLKKIASSRGGVSGSASRRRTRPGSSPNWKWSSMRTTRSTTRRTR